MNWASAQILVTGATGFIGRAVCCELERRGATVWRLIRDRGLATAKNLFVDLSNIEMVQRELAQRRFDGVLHLASAGVRHGQVSEEEMMRVNICGTMHLLSALESQTSCPIVISGSWTEYGPSTTSVMQEDQGCFPESSYGISKLSATLLARAWARKHRRALTVARLFAVYGPEEAPHRLIPTVITAATTRIRPALGSPSMIRDYLFLDDAVHGLLAALNVSEAGIVINIGTGVGVRVDEVVSSVSKYSGYDIEPTWGVFESRPWDVESAVADVSRCEQILHWKPTTSIAEGVRRIMS